MNKKHYHLLVKEAWLFLTALITLVVVLELIFEHAVQAYLNPVIVLIFWLIFGILYLVSNSKNGHQ